MSILIKSLKKEKTTKTPIWLMRQAGRHLPEYLKLKRNYSNLMEMFLDQKAIVEASLQPVEKYNLDATILFSDILIVPYILGGQISFGEKESGPLVNIKFQENNINFSKVKPIYDAIKNIKEKNQKPLIGFCGGVWSTLYYCLFNTSERKKINKNTIKEKTKKIKEMIPRFTDTTIEHSLNQIRAGIDVFQIFESWSGLLNDEQFEEWCMEPARKIFAEIKSNNTHTIGFPRGATLQNYVKYSNIKNLDCLSLDTNFDLKNLGQLNQNTCFQGNLDPQTLLKGKEELIKSTRRNLAEFKKYPHIFNLGHGVLPETPTTNVKKLIKEIRAQ
jgi:uroporphyrinogen decarboxylase